MVEFSDIFWRKGLVSVINIISSLNAYFWQCYLAIQKCYKCQNFKSIKTQIQPWLALPVLRSSHALKYTLWRARPSEVVWKGRKSCSREAENDKAILAWEIVKVFNVIQFLFTWLCCGKCVFKRDSSDFFFRIT